MNIFLKSNKIHQLVSRWGTMVGNDVFESRKYAIFIVARVTIMNWTGSFRYRRIYYKQWINKSFLSALKTWSTWWRTCTEHILLWFNTEKKSISGQPCTARAHENLEISWITFGCQGALQLIVLLSLVIITLFIIFFIKF